MSWTPGDTVSTACQETAGLYADGYGHRKADGRQWKAHRYVIYEVGHDRWGRRLDEGECVMHLCDNRACIRYDHLRVGSVAENNADRRAKERDSNLAKTHCKSGHPFNEANTAFRKATPLRDARRVCMACSREQDAKRRAAR